jgi:hypothetical protein
MGRHIFHQLVADLLVLEIKGIKIGAETYYVVVAAIAGDNLCSHCIGGFGKILVPLKTLVAFVC